MSFVVLLEDGISLITARQDDTDFDPLLGTAETVDVSPFWDFAPDDLQLLPPQEQRLFESMWRGLVQIFGGLLGEAAHLDALKSLSGFPVHFERRWLRFEIERTVEAATDVAEVLERTEDVPLSQLTTYESEGAARAQYDLYGTDGVGRIGYALRSVMGTQARTHWTANFTFDWNTRGGSDEVWVLWGYANTQARRYARHSGIFLALSNAGRVGVLVVLSGGTYAAPVREEDVVWHLCPDTVAVTAGAAVSASMWYDGNLGGAGDDGAAQATLQVTCGGSSVLWEQQLKLESGTGLEVVPRQWWADAFVASAPPRAVAVHIPEMGQGDYIAQLRPERLVFSDPTVRADLRFIPSMQPRVSDATGIWRAGVEFDLVRDPRGAWGYLRFCEDPPEVLWSESCAMDLRLMRRIFGPLTGVEEGLDESDTHFLRTQIYGALYGLICGPHLTHLALALGGLLGAPMALAEGVVKSFHDLHGHPAIVVEEFDRDRVYPYREGLTPLVSIGQEVAQHQALVEMPRVYDWITAPDKIERLVGLELQKYSSYVIEIPDTFLMEEYRALPSPVSDADRAEFTERFNLRIRSYLAQTVGVWCGLAGALIQIASSFDESLAVQENVIFSGRRDELLATVTALPASPGGTAAYDANPVEVGDIIALEDAIDLEAAFAADAKAGYAFAPLEYDKTRWPKRRTSLLVLDALSGAADPRYNDGSTAYATGPTGGVLPPPGAIYNYASTWILDERLSITASYTGTPDGDQEQRIYDDPQTIAPGGSYTFSEPDYWDEMISPYTLDFGSSRNSGHTGGKYP